MCCHNEICLLLQRRNRLLSSAMKSTWADSSSNWICVVVVPASASEIGDLFLLLMGLKAKSHHYSQQVRSKTKQEMKRAQQLPWVPPIHQTQIRQRKWVKQGKSHEANVMFPFLYGGRFSWFDWANETRREYQMRLELNVSWYSMRIKVDLSLITMR